MDKKIAKEYTFEVIYSEHLEGRKTIADLLGHEGFLQRGLRISFFYARDHEEGEVLFQEVCKRILTHWERAASINGNIRNEEDFFKWVSVIAYHAWCDRLREKRKDGAIDQTPVEEHMLRCDTPDPDLKILVKEFKAFVYLLPGEPRKAVELWLEENLSYRKIAEILGNISHVTVGKWIADALTEFLNPPHVR